MRRLMPGLLFGIMLSGGAAAAERLWFDGRELDLAAQARACYLGFLKLYEVDYFRGEEGGGRCIRLSYLREFDADVLGEATRKVFGERHGEDAAIRYRTELERVARAYRAVVPGDQYLYCVGTRGEGRLLRDDEVVVSLSSGDFADRFLQIWVQAEPADRSPQWGFRAC